ncbi:RNA polymerase subunit sigma-24 [Chitinophaga caeni]|uniref:RNA polymerase subunit sigma-24 n=1 Tax=Chitinophaga caeni TaxID=2029983 RepID=A0A291QUS8_9BACT|nr:sigma-70 family RNA polymerase sigma factor [Chitinophaga caeni]ATL47789.1 RNA polymerase subunit sigma-24 [Chitinophaga caeni]
MSIREEIPENQLIELLQGGDVEAFDTLYYRYFKIISDNILRITKDYTASEDILQEVFVSLWEKRYTLKQDQPLANWLFVVSYNKSMNYLRNRMKEQLKTASIEKQHNDNGGLEQDWQLTEAQLLLLESAIEQLPPQRKRVFVQCKLQGKSYAEVAENLQISKYTVKEHIVKANEFIRDYIHMNPGNLAAIAFPVVFLTMW